MAMNERSNRSDAGHGSQRDQSEAGSAAVPDTEDALASEGGVGGRSGTGQAQPHRGVDDPESPDARPAIEADGDATDAMPTGATYQSGGTQQDRVQREAERKQRHGGAGVASSPQGGADPAPGAPAVGNRSR